MFCNYKKGDNKIKFENKHLKEMTFIGYYTEIMMNEGYEKCPEFWNKEYAEKYSGLFSTMTPANDEERAILENGIGMYALCIDSNGQFQY